MSTTSMSDKFFILYSSIKYIFPLILSSVLLTSGSTLAQGSPSSDTEELSRPTLTTPAEAVISTTVLTPDSKVAQAESKSADTVSSEQILVPLNGTEQVSLELVNRSLLGDHFLASLLLPKSVINKKWELEFDNRESKQQVRILNAAVIGRGKQTGYQLTPVHISVDKKETSNHEKGDSAKSAKSLQETDVNPNDANQIVRLPLTIELSNIPPDEYAGTIFLTMEGGQKINLPLNMKVRAGPLLPLGVLIFGIALGWFSKYMKEQGQPLVKAIQKINRLKLDIIEAPLNKEDQEKLLDRVDKARNFADRQDFDAVDKMIKDIRSMKEESEKRKLSTANDENVEESEKRKPSTANDENAEKVKKPIGQLVSNHGNEMHKFTQRLPDRIRSEATFRIAQPLLPILLVIGLSAVGLNSLYIDKKTFGTQPFPDYLNLIVWGLSADLASKSLTDLPGTMAKKQ